MHSKVNAKIANMFVYSVEKDKRSLLTGMQHTGDKGRVASFLPLALLSGGGFHVAEPFGMRAITV
jgi:hypothetical protein